MIPCATAFVTVSCNTGVYRAGLDSPSVFEQMAFNI